MRTKIFTLLSASLLLTPVQKRRIWEAFSICTSSQQEEILQILSRENEILQNGFTKVFMEGKGGEIQKKVQEGIFIAKRRGSALQEKGEKKEEKNLLGVLEKSLQNA